jgi:hypothetical protein
MSLGRKFATPIAKRSAAVLQPPRLMRVSACRNVCISRDDLAAAFARGMDVDAKYVFWHTQSLRRGPLTYHMISSSDGKRYEFDELSVPKVEDTEWDSFKCQP